MKTLLFSFSAVLLSTAGPVAAAEPSPRPNVLFIISDDQAWNDYGFMDHPHIATPNLDRLASESLVFTRGYTPVPLCRPSLATMITGLYPHQHGVTGNDPALPDPGVNPQTGRNNPKYERYYRTVIENFASHPNFVRDLTGRGYLALQTGKWWEGDPVVTAGFTRAMTVGTGKGDRHGGAGLKIGREGLEPITEFIEQAGETPWVIWYAPFLPHAPHTPPQVLLDKYLKVAPTEAVARYWACVEWFDQTCGELMRDLEDRQLRDNTVVLYACDNGWIQKPDQVNRFAPRSKQTAYEGGVRTPIMVSWPGHVKPRMDRKHPASTIDLWPTLAGLLDMEIPKDLPGIDLTDARAVAKRQAIFGEQYNHDITNVDEPTQSLEHRWIVEGDWKLIVPDPVSRPDGHPELYKVSRDPWETEDLAAKESKRVRGLVRQLDRWWTP